jgi:hypothetical protein
MVLVLFQLGAALGLAWGWSDLIAAGEKRGEAAAAARYDRVLLAIAVATAAVCFGGLLL